MLLASRCKFITSKNGLDVGALLTNSYTTTSGRWAAASLLQAVDAGEVDKDDCILLNMSGGGVNRLKKDISTRVVKPWLSVKKATGVSAVLDKLGIE